MDILADKQLKADFAVSGVELTPKEIRLGSGGELTPKEIRLGLKFIF